MRSCCSAIQSAQYLRAIVKPQQMVRGASLDPGGMYAFTDSDFAVLPALERRMHSSSTLPKQPYERSGAIVCAACGGDLKAAGSIADITAFERPFVFVCQGCRLSFVYVEPKRELPRAG
jgi:hypothetical protein